MKVSPRTDQLNSPHSGEYIVSMGLARAHILLQPNLLITDTKDRPECLKGARTIEENIIRILVSPGLRELSMICLNYELLGKV